MAMKVGDVESRAIHTHSNWTPEVTKIIYIPRWQTIKNYILIPKRGDLRYIDYTFNSWMTQNVFHFFLEELQKALKLYHSEDS